VKNAFPCRGTEGSNPASSTGESSCEPDFLSPVFQAAKKHPEGSFKVVNALAMAASYDPDPTQSLGIRLPVTFDTCEVIEDRWANWMRQDPVVAV